MLTLAENNKLNQAFPEATRIVCNPFASSVSTSCCAAQFFLSILLWQLYPFYIWRSAFAGCGF